MGKCQSFSLRSYTPSWNGDFFSLERNPDIFAKTLKLILLNLDEVMLCHSGESSSEGRERREEKRGGRKEAGGRGKREDQEEMRRERRGGGKRKKKGVREEPGGGESKEGRR